MMYCLLILRRSLDVFFFFCSLALCVADDPLTIDPLGEGGAKPGATSGALSFKNIKFAYPSRPNMQVGGASLCNVGSLMSD